MVLAAGRAVGLLGHWLRLRSCVCLVKYSPVSRHYSWCSKIEPSLSLTFRPAIFSNGQYCTRLLHNAKAEALAFRLAHQTDVDFPIDVPPFLCPSKRSNQLFKRLGMFGSVLKPRQKVEGFANITAMIKLPCD